MKPGLLDICVIIFSLAMAVILAFDIGRALNRADFRNGQVARPSEARKPRLAASPSTEVAFAALYH
jgi:hypothetical protein